VCAVCVGAVVVGAVCVLGCWGAKPNWGSCWEFEGREVERMVVVVVVVGGWVGTMTDGSNR
jgi:hypothetical protein